MAQPDRKFGQQTVYLYLGSTDFAGVLQNAEVAQEIESHEARALKDTARYPVPFFGGWRIEGECARDSLLANTLRSYATTKSQLAVSALVYYDPGLSTEESYVGNTTVEMLSHAMPEGAQTQRFRLSGRSSVEIQHGE